MKKEIKGPIDITDEIIEAASTLEKEGLIREVDEALDETLDEYHEMEGAGNHLHTVTNRLLLGNQGTILRVLQYLLTRGQK